MQNKTLKLAVILANDLSIDGLNRFIKNETNTLENCIRYGHSSRTVQTRLKAAKQALVLKQKGK